MKHKSESMSEIAQSFGWQTQIKTEMPENKRYDEIFWNLFCVRNQETLHVVFKGNAQLESTYTYGSHITHPAHRAAVLKTLGATPSFKRLRLDKEEKEQLVETRTIPFDHDSTALEILLAVLGKQITWIRRLDGEILSGVVVKESNIGNKYFRVAQTKNERRILEWQDREGFHSVALEQIIEVA